MSLRERLGDSVVNAAVTQAIMAVHTGPFQQLKDISVPTLWSWYRAIYRAAYRAALEEAARQCDEQRFAAARHYSLDCETCAARIRALAEGLDK